MTKNRFEVSTEGMALLHAGRPLWALVKELVANAWDEPSARTCWVDIQPSGKGLITIKVVDDGNGFSNIEDSFTLFGSTPKQRDAETRGRFNLGEKELISIARDAKIETVGHTITFPVGGGKEIRRNKRTRGTVVTVTLAEKRDQIARTVAKLQAFLPPVEKFYIVNGESIESREPFCEMVVKLPTILASAPGQPLRRTERKTRIYLYNLVEGKKAQIYEMGVPIQKIDMPYDVNIMQKVPLPPNRDVVSPRYLQAVFAETLVATVGKLDGDSASASWVKLALEDRDRVDDAIVKQVMHERFGDKVLISHPFDLDANDQAFNAGFDLINSRSLSTIERERYKENGLKTTSLFSAFGGEKQMERLVEKEITPDMRKVGDYAKWLSQKLLGFKCDVDYWKGGNHLLACYSRGIHQLAFNVTALPKNFFADAPTPEQTAIILHELAHQNGSEERGHGHDYVRALASLGAKLHHNGAGVWEGVREPQTTPV